MAKFARISVKNISFNKIHVMKIQIKLILGLLLINTLLLAQGTPPDNWFNLDQTNGGVSGVGTETMYNNLLKGKKSQTVIVAVIDSGVDYEHEDLKDVMWINQDEIPGNNIDDDNNGYVDDIHGWNFIGGKDGQNVSIDTYESTRVYGRLKKKYENVGPSSISGKDKKEYELYEELKKTVEPQKEEAAQSLAQIEMTSSIFQASLDAVEEAMVGKELTLENIKAIQPGTDRNLMIGREVLIQALSEQPIPSLSEFREELNKQIEFETNHYAQQLQHFDTDFNTREIVGDNYENSYEKGYGNNDVRGPDSFHGTHVAGIIAAGRDNDIGIKGVADNVLIMSVRAVPDGDERDKDVANAIIYAVDNGASIINMSFGKGYSWDKEAVDKAVKYAYKNDVLLIHAAGNSAQNNDSSENYPNDQYDKKGWFKPKRAKNWMEIGALSWKGGEEAIANFSNYGKDQVDVFAPGVDIYSTTPDQGYQFASGTSMASPVTAGVAAVLRSYYPSLTALQVKDIIMQSSSKVNRKVKLPGSSDKVNFSDLSQTGGVVNVYEAVRLAGKTKGKKKVKSLDVVRP